jgi:integrase
MDDVVHGELVPAGPPPPAADITAALRAPGSSRPLSAGARRLVAAGIPDSTRETYQRAWNSYHSWGSDLWGDRVDEELLPSPESTMIEYLHSWEGLPVHNRCNAGRQANGDACTGHRPAPSTMWIWYSAVRLAHSLTSPPWPWYGGKQLALAMKAYQEEMVLKLGWKPNKSPRAWPEHVMAMIDAIDLDDPKGVRDRAIILTGWYTAARASDLATYRLSDVVFTPRGVDLTLRASKTNKAVGKVTERRVVRPDPQAPQYDGVVALDAWVRMQRVKFQITDGALFRPFAKAGKHSGRGDLLRGARDDLGYRMASVSISDVVKERAVAAGVPDGEFFTEHSLRRGRASHLRSVGIDSLAIARAHGWVPGGAINEYLEEAEAFDDEAPANAGLLG